MPLHAHAAAVAALLAVGAALAPARAEPQVVQMPGPDVDGAEAFGEAVSMSGDGTVALVGSLEHRDGLTLTRGAAYVYVRSGSTWTQEARMTPDDPEKDAEFGKAVALSSDGRTALVAATHDNLRGAAYVFVRSGSSWTRQAKLLDSDAPAVSDDPERTGAFGESVSLSADGSTAMVGASHDDDDTLSGAAHVFVRSGSSWTQQAKLVPPPGNDALDRFGWYVSLSGNGRVALVGATGTDDNGIVSGSAYVYARSGSKWPQEARLLPDDGNTLDEFGSAVSLSADGGVALIGANGDGSAYTVEPPRCPEGQSAAPFVCRACPAGSFCPGGSAVATRCSTCAVGKAVKTACTAEADTQCEVSTGFVLAVVGGLLALVVLGLAVWHFAKKRSRRGHLEAKETRTTGGDGMVASSSAAPIGLVETAV